MLMFRSLASIPLRFKRAGLLDNVGFGQKAPPGFPAIAWGRLGLQGSLCLFCILFAYEYFAIVPVLRWITVAGFALAAGIAFVSPIAAAGLLLALLPAVQYLDLTQAPLPINVSEIFLVGIFVGVSAKQCLGIRSDQSRPVPVLRLILLGMAAIVVLSCVRQTARLHEVPVSILIGLLQDQLARIPQYYQLNYFYFIRRGVTVLAGLYLFWTLCSHLKNSKCREWLLFGWVGHAVVLVAICSYMAFTSGFLVPFDGYHEGRNAFGVDCLLSLAGLLAAFVYWRGRPRVFLMPLVAAVLLFGCATISRATILTSIALIVSAVIVDGRGSGRLRWQSVRGGRLPAYLIAAGGTCIVLYFAGSIVGSSSPAATVVRISQSIQQRFNTLSSTPLLDWAGPERVVTWKVAARMIAEEPLLGHGMGSFPRMDLLYAPAAEKMLGYHTGNAWNNAHNYFLQITAELGLIGLLVFVALIGWTGFQCVSSRVPQEWRKSALVVLAGLIAFCITLATEHTLLIPEIQIAFYAFAALGVVAGPEKRIPRWSRVAVILLLGVCGLGVIRALAEPTPEGEYGFYDWEGGREFRWASRAAFIKSEWVASNISFRILTIGTKVPNQVSLNNGQGWTVLDVPFNQWTPSVLGVPKEKFIRLGFLAGEVRQPGREGMSPDFRDLGFALSRLEWVESKDEAVRPKK